jgi:hypothetical protein
MKYTPLDNIGLPTYDSNGNLSSILAPGNNYPSNELGIPKSSLVSTREKNIVLKGIYDENEATYPIVNPIDLNITPITGTSFRFIININSPKPYTSETMYNDLISAYEEKNPWFTAYTVPNITLDFFYLKQYNLLNKFKITEAYCETTITSTIDEGEELCTYIDWLVSKQEKDINLKPINELGTWEYTPDGDLGVGVKPQYDSMIKDKDPDPEAIGAEIIRENYSFDLPPLVAISPGLQPLPPEEIVPKLVEAILSERVPQGKELYSFFGSGIFGTIAAVTLGAAVTILTGGLAGLAIGGLVATLSQQGISRLQTALGKFKGSWLEFILGREQNRGLFEDKDKVFKREVDGDTNDWNRLLVAAKGQMGITQYNQTHVKQALQVIFSQAGNNIKPADLSYPIKVGTKTKRMQVIPQSSTSVKINLK